MPSRRGSEQRWSSRTFKERPARRSQSWRGYRLGLPRPAFAPRSSSFERLWRFSMSCEEVREQLPDYSLGTLSDIEAAALRRHLRGCAGCRAEATKLDEGVALFASAAHAMEPPPELKSKVLGVLEEEWREAPPAKPRVHRLGM